MADFDLKKLEKELETAVDVEAKRQRIDDVKKRAIHSTGSYEEFRQRVLAVDLKPVPSTEFEGAFHRQKGDRVAKNRGLHRIDRTAKTSRRAAAGREFADTGVPRKAAKNVLEFGRDWRRHCKTDASRYSYFRHFTGKRVEKVFKNELDSVILGQVVAAMAACLPTPDDIAASAGAGAGAGGGAGGDAGAGGDGADAAATTGEDGGAPGVGDAVWAFRALRAFSRVGRFSLTLKLLNDADRTALGTVFGTLELWSGTRPADATKAVAAGLPASAKAVGKLRGQYLPSE